MFICGSFVARSLRTRVYKDLFRVRAVSLTKSEARLRHSDYSLPRSRVEIKLRRFRLRDITEVLLCLISSFCTLHSAFCIVSVGG